MTIFSTHPVMEEEEFILGHPVLYSSVLNYTVLYCTVLYCTVLYCTVLYSWSGLLQLKRYILCRYP